jgi:hypothetical protein
MIIFDFVLSFTADRVQPVLLRFKPNSRSALSGDLPDPWNLLLFRDALSRHRGADLPARYRFPAEQLACYPRRTLFHLEQPYFLGIARCF